MAFATCAGSPVLRGSVHLPRVGAWQADLELDVDVVPTGEVELRVGRALTLRGTVVSGGLFAGEARVRVVGGRGKLSTELPARWYVGAPLSLVLGGVADEAGERLSTTIDAVLLATPMLPAWGRTAGPAALALQQLAQTISVSWRVLPDGTLWLGEERWPAATGMADLVVLDEHRGEGRLLLSTEEPTLLPGQQLAQGKVSSVTYELSPSALRADVWLERVGTGATVPDRLKAALEGLLRAVLGRRLDYLARYEAVVVRQDGAGLLEVTPSDQRLPPLTRVPIRLGLPGTTVKVKAGARVILGFEAGDPRRPFADLWSPDSLDEITISADTKATILAPDIKLGGANLPAARQGDLVAVGGPLTLYWLTVPGTLPSPGSPPVPALLNTPLQLWSQQPPGPPLPQLYGTIMTGNPSVRE